jgi:uncharacterized protein (DUF58 family)
MNARLRAAILARRRRGVPGAGAPHPRRADGYEFAELREYQAGDDPRRIDWAATARAGGLQTRVMFEDHALVLAGALDASRSMLVGRERTVYDLALNALEVWYGAASAEDRCLRLSEDGPLGDPRRRGHVAALICGSLRDEPGASFAQTLRVATATVPRDAALLLVSDFYDLAALTPALGPLAARCDCTALVVRDPWYPGLPLGGFVRLRDAESGAIKRVYIDGRARAAYHDAVVKREQTVCAALRALGIRSGVLAEDAATSLLDAFGVA